jgi:hypothetical protein
MITPRSQIANKASAFSVSAIHYLHVGEGWSDYLQEINKETAGFHKRCRFFLSE